MVNIKIFPQQHDAKKLSFDQPYFPHKGRDFEAVILSQNFPS